ncbi:MAG: hypothetical protein ACR2FE_05180 [Aeromicrobium sp.]
MRRPAALLCVLAVVLGVTVGGCARADEPTKPRRTVVPQNTASSPSPQAPAKDSLACTLLTPKERRSIAGEKINIVAPGPSNRNAPQCRWVTTLSTPNAIEIKVVTQTVQIWLRGLPLRIDRTIRGGQVDSKYSKRLQAAKQKVLGGADEIGDAEACDLFSLMVEVNLGVKDLSQVVLREDATTAAVHKCSKGVYTVLTYSEPELTPSLPLGEAMKRLVKIAHSRAVKRL